MKKPIDPNLERFEDSVFSLTGGDDTPGVSYRAPQFEMKETSAAATPGEYHASENHRQRAEATGAPVEPAPGGEEHSHHHHHHHHSDSHSHSRHGKHRRHRHHHHHHHHHHRHHRLPKGARVVIGILVALLIIVALVVGAFLILNYDGEKKMTDTTAATDYQETIEYKGHIYVYNENVVTMAFLGVDKRELGKAENHTSTNGMADTDIVVAIDKVSGKTSMIAVPRDTMVDVDVFDKDGNFKKTKEMELCIAYAYGDGFGTSCKNVTKSISRILYNVPIDKYFALDLNGIQPINDSIGGVKVQSLYDLPDYGVKKGDTVHLTGDLTEAYVRTRDMDNLNASLNRTQRQVQYLNAFADKVRGSVTSDFSVITNLYNTASDYCTTDLTVSNVTYLGSLLLQKGVTDFQSYTLEGKMKAVENKEFKDYVYAGFYPDKDSLMQTVLDVFYTRIRLSRKSGGSVEQGPFLALINLEKLLNSRRLSVKIQMKSF